MIKKCFSYIMLCLCISTMLFCTACGKEDEDGKDTSKEVLYGSVESSKETDNVGNDESTKESNTGESNSSEELKNEEEGTDNKKEENSDEEELQSTYVTVSTSEELLNAIGPDAHIFVKPGYYNLSEYVEEVWENEGEEWNLKHPYVRLMECYDGVEVMVQNVNNLTIAGDAESLADTEIVVEPRYAGVLNFLNCNDLSLSFLTMGHTEYSECSGNVLNFYGCKQINMSAMDLYGCGVYGICLQNGSGDLFMYSSTIRDCSYGPLDLADCEGMVEFRNCIFKDSDGGGYYEENGRSQVAFYECTFGEWETNVWYFYDNITKEDCSWSEITEYPEYGWEEEVVPAFDPENMEAIDVIDELLHMTEWYGYAVVNPENGDTYYLPYDDTVTGKIVNVLTFFEGEKTGALVYPDYYSEFTWEYDGTDSIILKMEDGSNVYMSFYVNSMDEEGYAWAMLQLDGYLIWMY